MMLRHQLAVTALTLTLVGVGVTCTGVALMPQAGGNGPPVPAAAAAKKDEPAVKMVAVTAQIATTERKLADAVGQWKQTQPKVPAGELRAKAELLGAIDLLIFKSEVEIRKLEIQSEPLQAKLESIKSEKLTDEKLIKLTSNQGIFTPEDVQLLGREVQNWKNRVEQKDMSPESKKEAALEFEAAKKKYLASANAQLEEVTKSYQRYLGRTAEAKLGGYTASMKAEQLTLSVTTEKRKIIALELAQLEAVPAEPAAVVALRQELATLTAGREALKAQHPEAFDPATRSAVATEKLLHELVELRGEVKNLRDGK